MVNHPTSAWTRVQGWVKIRVSVMTGPSPITERTRHPKQYPYINDQRVRAKEQSRCNYQRQTNKPCGAKKETLHIHEPTNIICSRRGGLALNQSAFLLFLLLTCFSFFFPLPSCSHMSAILSFSDPAGELQQCRNATSACIVVLSAAQRPLSAMSKRCRHCFCANQEQGRSPLHLSAFFRLLFWGPGY